MRPSILIALGAAGLLLTSAAPGLHPRSAGDAAAWAPALERPSIRTNTAASCGSREKQCRMSGYVLWCCRADQICSRVTVGGCN